LDVAFDERLRLVPPGNIRQQTDRPRLALELPGRLFNLGVIGDIHLVRRDRPALRRAHRPRGGSAFFVHVEYSDGASFFGQAYRGGAPDSAGPAGHHNALSVQSAHSRSQFSMPVFEEMPDVSMPLRPESCGSQSAHTVKHTVATHSN